ncbi:phosphopantetheine--protein transferase domain-containing protein [Daejeonella rubra]|uniref:Phosphopantetheine--protein transferase domain-containing protein n=1 Tax=Daejeonella rubra TaxID=990371 RepID=A0A1G9V4X6_9SPHI|nr:4'-phosphopantetheinyl transferase superfamily protein [Daejeonella rubra]SDM67096.1 phosphopantetheine--protein transferase domain-containing protein [Daejeonella rubra]
MALAYHKEIDPYTSFAIWKIEESADELLAQLQLKEHERTYLDSLVNGKRNMHWLSTRVLLRRMMDTDEYIDCRVDSSGKPYLSNFPHYISLSHSYEYAAVMVSKNKAVGIDIELIKDKIERIASKFMSAEELEFIEEKQRIEHLYVCWCAKEAVYKLHGKKNVSFVENIELKPFHYEGKGSFPAKLDVGSTHKEFTVHYEKFDEYMIGFVSDDTNEE